MTRQEAQPAFAAPVFPGTAVAMARWIRAFALARTRDALFETVCHAARALCGVDGVTLAIRDRDQSWYAAEDALAPLFAPGRFPIASCLSGQVMLSGRPLVIPDSVNDSRVPHKIYEKTFVRAICIVPIGGAPVVGALGLYWATPHSPSPDERELQETLADSAAVALSNLAITENLEHTVSQRTDELAQANADLRAFAGNIAHELRGPLTVVLSASEHLLGTEVDAALRLELADEIHQSGERMNSMLAGLMTLARVTTSSLNVKQVDLSRLAREVLDDFARQQRWPGHACAVAPGLTAQADESLMRVVMTNLLSNAFKYSATQSTPQVSVTQVGHAIVVQDNGVGFDAANAGGFHPFKRFHDRSFEGTGLGLVATERALVRMGGKLRAESSPGLGAKFFFELPTG